MRALTGHLARNAVAYAALLVALSGTALAAGKLMPTNSVGTRQVIDHSLARKDVRRAQAPRGRAGLAGRPGPAGPRGATGSQGPQAALTGAAGGTPSNPASAAADVFQTASITLTAPGELLVLGRLDSISLYSPVSSYYTVGIYLDDKPVAGSGYSVPITCPIMFSCSGRANNVSLSAVAAGVSAGTHQVKLGGFGPGSPSAVGKVALAAVALG